jgi:hypothetical protein
MGGLGIGENWGRPQRGKSVCKDRFLFPAHLNACGHGLTWVSSQESETFGPSKKPGRTDELGFQQAIPSGLAAGTRAHTRTDKIPYYLLLAKATLGAIKRS